MTSQTSDNLPVGRNLKIGLFHLGSGMADVMATGVWNRIMISDLGFSATPVGLLVSLRYFLAPLGIWAGRQSDERSLGGYRRLTWIWFGRALMAFGLLMLGVITGTIARGEDVTPVLWVGITVSLLLFSVGTAFSGGTFLALIYDRAAPHQRGRAVGIVWTFLLVGFTIGGIVFGIMLPSGNPYANILYFHPNVILDRLTHPGLLAFSPATLQNLFVVVAMVLGALWFVSLVGEERRSRGVAANRTEETSATSLMADLRTAWSNRQTRLFFWYLSLSMAFTFSQDLILEPFAADVFGMDARHTTRFAAYWGSMSILGTIAFLILSRRVKRLSNTNMSYMGVGVLVVTFALFAVSSFAEIRGLVTPGLILLGLGLGFWNVGTLGLMMDMSPFGRAGTFLGFWTLVVTLARGIGVSGGGIGRDIALQLSGSVSLSYGLMFAIGMVGLAVSYWVLSRVNVKAFQAVQPEVTPADTATVLAGAMD